MKPQDNFDDAVNSLISRLQPALTGEPLGVGLLALQKILIEAFAFVDADRRDEAIRIHIASLYERYPGARTQ